MLRPNSSAAPSVVVFPARLASDQCKCCPSVNREIWKPGRPVVMGRRVRQTPEKRSMCRLLLLDTSHCPLGPFCFDIDCGQQPVKVIVSVLMSMPLQLLRSSSASGSVVVERYGSWAGRQLVVVMGRRVRPEKHNMRPEVLVDTGQAALVTSD